MRCWIAPRDIMAGTSYGEAIIEAIHGARVMVLVFSSHANASGHIPKEVERAASSGVAILPFRIEDVAPGKSLDYFIGSVHWLDAMTPPMEKHLDNLAATVKKLLPVNAGEHGLPAADISAMWMRSVPSVTPPIVPPATQKVAVRSGANRKAGRKSSSKAIWIGLALVLVAAIVITTVVILRDGGESQSETTTYQRRRFRKLRRVQRSSRRQQVTLVTRLFRIRHLVQRRDRGRKFAPVRARQAQQQRRLRRQTFQKPASIRSWAAINGSQMRRS